MVCGRLACILVAVAAVAACSPETHEQPADLVFRGGAVYTVDPGRSWATAVAVRAGRIIYVGDDKGLADRIGPQTQVIDLAGKMLMPGFHDSHMHPMAAGTRFLRCDLNDLAWPDEVRERIVECSVDVEPGKWLRGVNLNAELFRSGELNISLLDEWVPDIPVFITAFTGFEAWVSSSVLELAGIDRDTPVPDKGEIERDPVTGELTGVLRNLGMQDVYPLIPLPDTDDLRLALKKASQLANGLGITSSSEASMRPELFEAFVQAEAKGELSLRIKASQYWNDKGGLEQIEEMIRRRDLAEGGLFSAGAVKFFLDGSTNRTGAVLQPYVGTQDDFGSLTYNQETLNEAVRLLDAAGMQVHMHSYYDAAVRQGLDAIEAAIKSNSPRDRRHFLAHVALVDPPDLERFSQLGVSANISPLWAYLSANRRQEMAALGEERGNRLLAFNSLFGSGALVTAGSDWISESMNPLYSIQVALTRRPPDGSGPAWNPEQRVHLEQIIEAYTINGAWLMGLENETGSIEVGKAADLIVLEENLFEIDPMKLSEVKVLLTLLEGETVYRDHEAW